MSMYPNFLKMIYHYLKILSMISSQVSINQPTTMVLYLMPYSLPHKHSHSKPSNPSSIKYYNSMIPYKSDMDSCLLDLQVVEKHPITKYYKKQSPHSMMQKHTPKYTLTYSTPNQSPWDNSMDNSMNKPMNGPMEYLPTSSEKHSKIHQTINIGSSSMDLSMHSGSNP